jgi:hypothetical protein
LKKVMSGNDAIENAAFATTCRALRAFSAAIAVLHGPPAASNEKALRPNIVPIFAEDLG